MNFSCAICFDLFDGRDIVATPCGHIFHSKCIFKWLDSSKDCPECRNKIKRNDVIKLFFNTSHNSTLLLSSSLQNDLDSKDAELIAKDSEIATARKKVKDLQEHAANTEQMYHTMHQKYLATQLELKSAKLHLKKIDRLDSRIQMLVKENLNLESQVNQFNNIHTVLQGTQHEADEILREQGVLLAQEVGGSIAKNMANLCSILRRELSKLRAQKEDYKKREDELLYNIGLKNAKCKKLMQIQENLQRRLSIANNSPRPMMSDGSSANVLPSSTESEDIKQLTPVADDIKILSASSSINGEKANVTPISINFSDKKRPTMKKIVLDNSTTQKFSSINSVSHFPKPLFPPFNRKLDVDKDTITRVGYNGLGGHERVIFARARELSKTKPYKKNPNVKRVK